MDRRVLLAMVLCLAVVLGWFQLQKMLHGDRPPSPKDGVPAAPPDGGMADGANPPAPPANPPANPVANPPAPPPGPPAPPAKPPVQPQDPVKPFSVPLPESSELLDVGFTNRGGALRYWTLRNSYEFPDKKHPLDLVLPSDEDLLSLMLTLADDADAERMRTLTWTRDVAAEAATKELDVVFTFDTTAGLRVTKRFVLPTEPGRFDCDVEVSAALLPGRTDASDVVLRLLGTAGMVREPQDFTTGLDAAPSLVSYVLGATDEPTYDAFVLKPIAITEPRYSTKNFRLLGVRTQYFTATLWADGTPASPRVKRIWGGGPALAQDAREPLGKALVRFYQTERGRFLAGDQQLSERIEKWAKTYWLQTWAEFDLKPAAGAVPGEKAVFHLFVGPSSRHVFGEDRYEPLAPMITYPYAPDFIARGLLAIFDFFNGILGSAGIAVILMTLVVRGGMMPLSARNQLSMRRYGRRISKLKPKVEALKKKWANDRKRFQEEQMKLYREHGIGFPTGCLMMFLQIPIFMGLFSSLRVDFDLHHQSFLWIKDLSGPDRLIDFGSNVWPLPLPYGGISGINLLPLLSVVLSIWQQKMMPKPTDEQQAQQMKMMKWMPIFFAVLLYNYTAGLSLYMIFSSTIAILESKWVKHRDALEQAA